MTESFAAGEVLSLLSDALAPIAPPTDVRERLMTALDGPARYLPFNEPLAALFDLPGERMAALLARIRDREGWTQGVAPILGFMHFRPGPERAPLHGGFVRMQAGLRFPLHRHRAREVTFVLEGQLVDGDGKVYGPGDAVDMAEGSVHTLGVTTDGEALVALLHGGIEMLGE